MKELKNLLPETLEVLKKLGKTELLSDFTFVGGSALALYLNHRYSEDIDLFSWNEDINHLQPKYKVTIKDIEKHFVNEIIKLNNE